MLINLFFTEMQFTLTRGHTCILPSIKNAFCTSCITWMFVSLCHLIICAFSVPDLYLYQFWCVVLDPYEQCHWYYNPDPNTFVDKNAFENAWGPFYWHGLTVIPAWISNHMPCKVWDEIIYTFLNFNGCTVEVWEWISNFIPYFIMDVIIYPWWD